MSEKGSLLEVPAGGGWVEDGELEPLVGTDDKDSPACHRHPTRILLVRVQHSQLHRQLPRLIADYTKRKLLIAQFSITLYVLPNKFQYFT